MAALPVGEALRETCWRGSFLDHMQHPGPPPARPDMVLTSRKIWQLLERAGWALGVRWVCGSRSQPPSQAGRSRPWSSVRKGCSSRWGLELTTWPRGGGPCLPLPPLSRAREPTATRNQDQVLLELGGGHNPLRPQVATEQRRWWVRLTPTHVPSGASLYLLPHPNLHFNLTIPGDLQEPGPPVLAVDRRARSLSPSLSSAPKWAWLPHPGPGQGGMPLAPPRRQRPHREGLTAAQASTMSCDLCPLVVCNRRLCCVLGKEGRSCR